jgi:hypothetical protein
MLERLRRLLTRQKTIEDASGSLPEDLEPEPAVTVTDEGLRTPPPPGAPRVTSVRAVQARLAVAQELFTQESYAAAMNEVLAVLDVYPKNAQALSLAQSLLYLGLRAQVKERIPRSLFEDPLLDSLLSQCNRCHGCWPVNPMYKNAAGLAVTNPVGGRCPECEKVWCRTCAPGAPGGGLSCPECGKGLEILREPTGRKRGLRPLKHPELNLVMAFVFKAPPEPRNEHSYITMVLDALCPDLFHSKARIHFLMGREGTDQNAAMAYSTVTAMKLGIRPAEKRTFVESFTDETGPGTLITIYESR